MQQIRIVPLGISAGTPTRERNVAGLAVVLDGRALLFDCGEGTQHQLIRAPFNANRIEAIFISHLHGDHLYGLPGLLATFSMLDRRASLAVYGPAPIREFVDAAMRTSRLWLDYELVIQELEEGEIYETEGLSVTARALEHRLPSYGFAISEGTRPGRFDPARAAELGVPAGPMFGRLQRGESITLADGSSVAPADVSGPRREGRRIVIAGDTRPCRATVELARGSNVLVHEATYTDEMWKEADERGHSTAREAAEVARDAGVSRLLLTHFSPRYTDLSPLLAEARRTFAATELCEELVGVGIED
jgi:ribonuclease Z